MHHPLSSTVGVLRHTPLAAALALLLAGSATSPSLHAAPASADHTARAYALQRHHRLARADHPIQQAAPAAARQPAATLPVTNCLDDNSAGSLRSVLASANEGDTVDLSALTCSTITLSQGTLDTSVIGDHFLYDITLQGPGRNALTITAAGQSQVFQTGGFSSDKGRFTVNDLTIADGTYTGSLAACINSFGGEVALNRVTITNCRSSGTYDLIFGGAVAAYTLSMTDSSITNSRATVTSNDGTAIGGGAYVGGVATLVNSTISGNTVTAALAENDGYFSVGGGLYVKGDLTLTNSTISGNAISATVAGQDADGGGINVRGVVTISGSTFDGNSADGNGGGLYKAVFSVYGDPPPPQDTFITIRNSTFSGNSAKRGGGIAVTRPLTLTNSTVATNSAVEGAGGLLFDLATNYDSSGVLDLQSTIIAGNTVGTSATLARDVDADAPVTVTAANNLVTTNGTAVPLPVGTLTADPQLSPLAANGGPTRTMALAVTSPAVNAGSNAAALAFDQRGTGFPRVVGASADIGAFEFSVPVVDVIFRDGFDVATVLYLHDDGDGDTNNGPPSSFSPDMLWGNYYLTQPGANVITRISVAFGPTFPSLANGPVTFWLLDDPDADGDPRNATALTHVTGTPDVFNDNFFTVTIPPTQVSGAFFVGASAKLAGGQDRPARVDTNGPGATSWFFYAPDIATVINTLSTAPFASRMDNTTNVIFPGAFMVRATGTSAN